MSFNFGRGNDLLRSTLPRWTATVFRYAFKWWQQTGGGAVSQSSPFEQHGLYIPFLSIFMALGDSDVHFCTVIALHSFPLRTLHTRSESQELLFISLVMVRFKDISRVVLANWVSTIVRQVYVWWQSQAGDVRAVLPFTTARPHGARDWASTLAVLRFGLLAELCS